MSGTDSNADQFKGFLKKYHTSDIIDLMKLPEKAKNVSIQFDFHRLLNYDPSLGKELLANPLKLTEDAHHACIKIQRQMLTSANIEGRLETKADFQIVWKYLNSFIPSIGKRCHWFN
jgi:DNA replicative helicase MCM subunit Mcm2 (Cdc46/Mcm family)